MKVLKNIKDKIINNKKYILGIITGILISGTTVYAATVISAANVSYSNTSSKLSSTDVQSAIDELKLKVDSTVPIDPDTFITNSSKNIYASSKGICIVKNNKLNCFKINNYENEREHALQVFTNEKCYDFRYGLQCFDDVFKCGIQDNGNVSCRADDSGSNQCTVSSWDGSVDCS